ncbi:uncharacterized protein LOC108161403 [Drosophila miranda]|uniref:uncharacterized protein LOC108161403 n=1 Tax=Drosophila miranda TaxID=7229 RepID=UPI0007E81E36|nr:uncharacterized protein LOC108161403 [Drosophila miranda]
MMRAYSLGIEIIRIVRLQRKFLKFALLCCLMSADVASGLSAEAPAALGSRVPAEGARARSGQESGTKGGTTVCACGPSRGGAAANLPRLATTTAAARPAPPSAAFSRFLGILVGLTRSAKPQLEEESAHSMDLFYAKSEA